MSPLASLISLVIQQHADRGEILKYADIARKGGRDITGRDISKWATQKDSVKLGISLEKRRALAIGLERHPMVVDRAVLETAGYWLASPDDDYRTDPELDRRDRDKIAAYIQGIKEAKGRGRRQA